MLRPVAVLVLMLAPVLAAAQEESQTPPAAKDVKEEKPEAADSGNPRVKLATTLGDIVLELDAGKAPISVSNFLRYVDAGFYNGTIFHRVISNFMIQGGGHLPDLSQKREGLNAPIKNEWSNGLKNKRGTIAMARTNTPHSATAQFFINVVDNDRLDAPQSDGAAYCVFGKVVEGMDVVDKIRDTKVVQHEKYPSPVACVPAETVEIKSATVLNQVDREKLAAAAKAAEAELEKRDAEARARANRSAEEKMNEYVANMEKELGKKSERTDSGLVFWILTPGDGPSPKATDTVKVHYTGWHLDGKEFDSSVKRGQPAEFGLQQVIAGWTEGVALMKVGEKRRLVIPYQLAYGERGRPGIPPKSPLVFDIELLEVK